MERSGEEARGRERYTRAFGAEPEAPALARAVLDCLEHSAAWAAYVDRFGPGPSHGFVWVGVDGGPLAPIEYGTAPPM